MNSLIQQSSFILTLILVLNVTLLNGIILHAKTQSANTASAQQTMTTEQTCDASCRKQIVEELAKTMPTPIVEKQKNQVQIANKKEEIITIGSGSTRSKEWQHIQGAEITIDTSLYSSIKEVYFEAYVSIPTANGFAQVKLFNESDKRDVWFSEMSMETDKVAKLEKKISLEPGKKTYSVMMKSTMGYDAVLHTARLRIIFT